MAKKILNTLTTDLSIRIKKDGTRRTTSHIGDDVGQELTACTQFGDIAALAMKYGMRKEEVEERSQKAPNFGQFRMVIGNRIRGILARMDKGMDRAEAAYPKEAAKARREAKAAERAKTKAKPAAKAVIGKIGKAGKVVKKAVKKGPNPAKGIKVMQEDGTITNSDGSPTTSGVGHQHPAE